MQRLVDDDLVGAERAAALQDEHDLPVEIRSGVRGDLARDALLWRAPRHSSLLLRRSVRCFAASVRLDRRRDRRDDAGGLRELLDAVADRVSVRDPREVGVGRPHVALRVLVHEEADRPVEPGIDVMNCVPSGGLPNTSSVDGCSLIPASAASFDWSIAPKNRMPLSAMSFLMRAIVSSMP